MRGFPFEDLPAEPLAAAAAALAEPFCGKATVTIMAEEEFERLEGASFMGAVFRGGQSRAYPVRCTKRADMRPLIHAW